MYNRMYECDSKQVQLSMCVHCECLIVCTCVQMSVRVGTCVSVCVFERTASGQSHSAGLRYLDCSEESV